MQTDGAAVGVLDTVVRLAFQWAGWIVAALGMAAAAFSAWFAYRSARAAERSLGVAKRSAGAAEASADVARKALGHAEETEARRARSVVVELATQVRAAIARTYNLSLELEDRYRELGGYDPPSAPSALVNRMKELAELPNELAPHEKRAEDRDPDSLRGLTLEELEKRAAALTSDLADLQFRFERLTTELRDVNARFSYE